MEKTRNTKKRILIILLLIVVGLSIGFAAFTSRLTIQSTATVNPNPNTFKVVFSASKTESVAGSLITDGTYAQTASFSQNATTLTGLQANFTAPGQTATWTVYSFNAGEYDAFLNTVTVGSITCTAKEGTDQTKVTEAAKGISLTVTVGTESYTTTTEGITDHHLLKGAGEEITITLTYAAGSEVADGDFDVTIGDIVLGYDSVD